MPNPSELARKDELTSFDQENFSSRRTTGHNLYDPNATITQGELDAGFTFENSFRPVAATVEEYRNAKSPFSFAERSALGLYSCAPPLCHPEIHNIGPGENLRYLAPRQFRPNQDPNRTTKLSDHVERNTAPETFSPYDPLYLESSGEVLLGCANFSAWHDGSPQFLHIWGTEAITCSCLFDIFVNLEQATQLRDWLTAHIDYSGGVK